MTTRTPLQAMLDKAYAELGQKKKVAEALGIEPPWFSRLFNGKAVASSLGVEPCFKLAELVKEHPSVVLRATGKADLADALDAHYGATRRPLIVPVPDPIVRGLAEALAGPKPDRAGALFVVNLLRKDVGLPAIEQNPARRGGHRR